MIKVKRIYDPPEPDDGFRVLVDRLWPRGIRKDQCDLWLKEAAPSSELRRWYDHEPAKWAEFCQRYRAELHEHPDAVALLRDKARGTVTLLYAARERERNNAVALKALLGR